MLRNGGGGFGPGEVFVALPELVGLIRAFRLMVYGLGSSGGGWRVQGDSLLDEH